MPPRGPASAPGPRVWDPRRAARASRGRVVEMESARPPDPCSIRGISLDVEPWYLGPFVRFLKLLGTMTQAGGTALSSLWTFPSILLSAFLVAWGAEAA